MSLTEPTTRFNLMINEPELEHPMTDRTPRLDANGRLLNGYTIDSARRQVENFILTGATSWTSAFGVNVALSWFSTEEQAAYRQRIKDAGHSTFFSIRET